MQYLQITDSNRNTILELFNKSVDSKGWLVEKKTGKNLVCPYSKELIHVSNFSILPGSTTFVNNRFYAFAEHRVSHE